MDKYEIAQYKMKQYKMKQYEIEQYEIRQYEIKRYEDAKNFTLLYGAMSGTLGVAIVTTGYLLEGVISAFAGVSLGAMAMYCHKQQRDLESKVRGSLEKISEGLDGRVILICVGAKKI